MEGLSYPTETSSAQWELELTARDICARAVRAAPGARRDGRRPGDPAAWRPTSRSSSATPTSPTSASPCTTSAPDVVLDASRCWLCYWIVHALALLGESLPPDLADDVVEFLAINTPTAGSAAAPARCPTSHLRGGGVPHGSPPRLRRRRPRRHLQFLRACHDDATGGYRMHEGGETVTRGCYTALAVAHLTGLTDPGLAAGVPDSSPGARRTRRRRRRAGRGSAGGYTFCGLAAAVLCGRADAVDLPSSCIGWRTDRVPWRVGSWVGRINSSTDVTPSGRGARFRSPPSPPARLLRAMPPTPGMDGDGDGDRGGDGKETETGTGRRGRMGTDPRVFRAFPRARCSPRRRRRRMRRIRLPPSWDPTTPPFSSRALQGWLLLCCQLPNGGLQDKPGKGRDHYHTCYCLSRLSVAQHWGRDGLVGPAKTSSNPPTRSSASSADHAKWMAMVAAPPNPTPR